MIWVNGAYKTYPRSLFALGILLVIFWAHTLLLVDSVVWYTTNFLDFDLTLRQDLMWFFKERVFKLKLTLMLFPPRWQLQLFFRSQFHRYRIEIVIGTLSLVWHGSWVTLLRVFLVSSLLFWWRGFFSSILLGWSDEATFVTGIKI